MVFPHKLAVTMRTFKYRLSYSWNKSLYTHNYMEPLMTRSDIGVITIIYATCLLFYYMTLQLKAAAQIYPTCLIAGLALLNTLYLAQCLYKYFKAKQQTGQGILNDLPEIFKGFLPRQFFFIICACIAYLALLNWLGFYIAGLIFLAGVMLWLRVKPLQICITIIVLGLLVYGVFSEFLTVPLPKGIIFS